MKRPFIERRLRELEERRSRLILDLAVADEQLAYLEEEADDARVRHLVAETPISEREGHDLQRQVSAMTRHRDDLLAQIFRVEIAQSELSSQTALGE